MTTKELIKTFADHCDDCEYCFRCRFYLEGNIGECLEEFLRQVDSGKIKPEDGFETKRRTND